MSPEKRQAIDDFRRYLYYARRVNRQTEIGGKLTRQDHAQLSTLRVKVASYVESGLLELEPKL